MGSQTVVLDRPEQLEAWRYWSAISQLGLEIVTGHNYYGSRGSVLKGLQRNGMTPVVGRATRKNRMLALAGLLFGANSSPVIDRGRKILTEACQTDGITITVAAVVDGVETIETWQ